MNKRFRPIVILALLVVMLAALVLIFRQRPQQPVPGPVSGKLVVHFLDIGQGDSELIELPDGETILIDSGDRGAPTVDLLRKYGVRQIDLIIATHPHSDHMGEMRDVMRAFKVQEFWDSGFNHPTKTYADMLQEIKDQGIKFATPKRGDLSKFGEVLIEVLNPANELPDNNPNNASIVIRLTYGAKRFLFTGDAEMYEASTKPSAWEQMLETENDKLHADLLKAAHHGSSNGTTREVLNAVNPSIVTISCAAGNDYHHPHPKVIRMLEEASNQIKLYRTDLEGTITAVCDGATIEMTSDKQIARDRLYLTGDEVAGTVANDRREGSQRSRRSAGGAR
ncbi:MAG TPA: MBL fold metallo-hydrolase [Blastocatellia bacterium]|nr:MBL fold metallo-hydrolase [Blastocatellia bacterium]